jgi:MFS family permease
VTGRGTDAPVQKGLREAIRSTVPARVDRLPWSPFHTRMVVALGVCWVLDGFEIAVAANIGPQLTKALDLSSLGIGFMATVYLLGEVLGALVFGKLSDRLGRRRLFFATLATYFVGSALTALVVGPGGWAFPLLCATRFVAGAGIGGEYAAINSMIDELVPAVYRGRVDIVVNGTYWAGAALAGLVQIPLLSGAIDPAYDWRLTLLVGPLLALVIIFLRRDVPESPRWQIINGRRDEAERTIADIEDEVRDAGHVLSEVTDDRAITIRPLPREAGYLMLLRVLFREYPRRSILGATLMITQSFLYNAIFFTYASVLVSFFDVDRDRTAVYLIPFALGNLLGPLALGPLFDKLGRRQMISQTYVVSGVLLVASGLIFRAGGFTAATQTLAWCVIFFFASAGASAGYLTVSEIFPMEVRAKAIAVFFAIAQGCGSLAPLFYASLIDQQHPDRSALFVGFLIGAAVMIAGGLVARHLAVDAENTPLEEVARPLSWVENGRD